MEKEWEEKVAGFFRCATFAEVVCDLMVDGWDLGIELW
jgi:hypothetical protein